MSENPSLFARLFTWAGGYVGCGAILGTALGFAAGMACGLLLGDLNSYFRQYQVERELIDPILASDPAFRELQCSQRSNGGINLRGAVPTEADRDRLRERIVRAVGEKRADEIMYGVQVLR
jgi:hypothetical protein